jgi:hypothetical protein
MPLSWNEIKARAVAFSKEWENDVSEDAEAKSFWDAFFYVFDVSRRRVATFEQQVKKIDEKAGFIDLLWKGVILVEHKSRGKDLDRAYQQAKDYFPGLKDKELPRYILVSDFERFRLYDLEAGGSHEFKLKDFVQNVHLFGFIAGYEKRVYKEQDPVNIEAAELMGRLHDKLKGIGYEGHQLELYLVRLLFCLFADDTSIFEKGIFYEYIDLRTSPDGSDLAAHIGQIFQVLNTAENRRYKNLDEALAAFPYVNGRLFEETLPIAHFDSDMRKILKDCCTLDWGKISPAIFGSLFQSVMDEKARRNLGAHYTSERNILKLIKPLFLDALWTEFQKSKNDKRRLQKLHERISKLRFLDPACGCGNFLIIAYRELRLLELEIVKALLKGQQVTSVNDYFLVDVDQFYGIEYEEFPSQIAQVAMWLIDHQMNDQASVHFGQYFKRIPLKKSATIVQGNALHIDWQAIIDSSGKLHYDFILGNPPFIGSKFMTAHMRDDLTDILQEDKGAGVLDYVCGWYIKAAKLLQGSQIKCAFVSTNSITQGEQVGILWKLLFNKYHIKIHFAHRTFKWNNEAKGVAAVHVVIIGFAAFDNENKRLYTYETLMAQPYETIVYNINPYLVEGRDNFIESRGKPICSIPEIGIGNKPIDGGFYLFTEQEKVDFLIIEPKAEKYFRKWLGAHEFLNGYHRWCLWLGDANPTELRAMPEVTKRIEEVRKYRLLSPSIPTKKLAQTPTRFHVENMPHDTYLIIPEVSSERRHYIPIGFESPATLASNLVKIVPNASIYHFGMLMSLMHMVWVKYVCGRLKSDYRYSKDIVYNNYPWPQNVNGKQKQAMEKAAQQVLDVRAQFPDSSLADLYDPNAMPPALMKAHQQLDKAVDLCYLPQPFINETKRIEYLFELYDKYTAGLFAQTTKKAKARKISDDNA